MVVRVRVVLSTSFHLLADVPQGVAISPPLYNLLYVTSPQLSPQPILTTPSQLNQLLQHFNQILTK